MKFKYVKTRHENCHDKMGVIEPEVADKPMEASTQSMRHLSALGMRLWKMWREAEG